MKIIGFNYIKILGNKQKELSKIDISTDIKFVDLTKEESPLFNDKNVVSLSFNYAVLYKNTDKKEETLAEIQLEGRILLSLSEDESKELWKSWKKKEISASLRLFLFNFILRKCTTKALALQDEIGLPSHIPLPKLATSKQ